MNVTTAMEPGSVMNAVKTVQRAEAQVKMSGDSRLDSQYTPLPVHKFIPGDNGNLELPYPQAINRVLEAYGGHVILCEHDIEYAPEVVVRFSQRVHHAPERVHAAPYLLQFYDKLFFSPRDRNKTETFHAKIEGMVEDEKEGFVVSSPHLDKQWNMAVPTTVFYKAVVAGGKTESDYFGLGFTYIPLSIWRKVYPQVKDTYWKVLDDSISNACSAMGEKALIEWDCLVNHTHLDWESLRHEEGWRKKWP